ncbi:DUF6515 family protein [Maribacter sp. MAR_2009_72]|uniref:DUF6515 family protein n=1 Tax=Maribacter sp. MAR_2009_72 TaxID=1250050 RepID=UPI00119AC79B|nr:DUF6515 family protein [Maribacter sp. MAR_2009_72]TVZ16518.1 hypothetical protein JM81_2779 [Maribacter sp. MAR_2009_72]
MKTTLNSIPIILALIMLVSFSEKTYAQNSRRTGKTVIIKKDNPRIPSSRVVYKKPKKKIVAVRTLPKRTTIVHRGNNYYYSGNRFYTYSGGRYIVIAPKVGFRIQTLPAGFIRINRPSRTYYWANGVFYAPINDQYEVVDPEIGTVIQELPDGYERVEIDGYTYYEFSNVLYEAIQINGTRAYEVVGFVDQ